MRHWDLGPNDAYRSHCEACRDLNDAIRLLHNADLGMNEACRELHDANPDPNVAYLGHRAAYLDANDADCGPNGA